MMSFFFVSVKLCEYVPDQHCVVLQMRKWYSSVISLATYLWLIALTLMVSANITNEIVKSRMAEQIRFQFFVDNNLQFATVSTKYAEQLNESNSFTFQRVNNTQ